MSHPERRCATRLRVCSPTAPTDTPGPISFVCILQEQTPRDRVHEHLSLLWYVRIILHLNQTMLISADPSGDMYAPDSLAFLLVVYLAIRSKASSVKIPTILGTMAEDATWYFLVIFTSHFVLEMTLILGRVSATAPFPTAPNETQYVPLQESIQLLPAA